MVDRDTKRVELLRLSGGRYEPAEASADGGLTARTLGVSFSTLAGPPPRLHVADAAQPSIQAEI